tara:strand:+ start:161 stop:1264 length:1104 start_codon:yes stop_codon:yes gene_type:complete
MKTIIIIGFGISTLCFLLYLYENDLFKNFDIMIIEKNLTPCYSSLKYNINSNSTLKSLLSMFTNDIFKKVITRVFDEYDKDKYISLLDYNSIIMELSQILIDELESVNVKYNFEVINIDTIENKFIINNSLIADKIILATGGEQTKGFLLSLDKDNILKDRQDKIIIPHHLFQTNDLSMFKDKNILLSGSSHSIFSIIDLLLMNKIKYKSILIYHRSKIKVFYYNEETCLLSGDQCNKDDICSETGFVNRFDGIREKSKEIYLNIHNMSNISFTKDHNSIDFGAIDYIIPCWGYYKKLPIIDDISTYNIDSTMNFELILNNNIKHNIYLLGFMSNPKISCTQESFKKSIDGVWYYYNIISKHMYNLL